MPLYQFALRPTVNHIYRWSVPSETDVENDNDCRVTIMAPSVTIARQAFKKLLNDNDEPLYDFGFVCSAGVQCREACADYPHVVDFVATRVHGWRGRLSAINIRPAGYILTVTHSPWAMNLQLEGMTA